MITSLNISEKLPTGLVEVYSQIHGIAAELSVPLLIVGATARDIILVHGYNTAIERGTKDVDFGIEVQNWEHYEVLRTALIEAKENLRFNRVIDTTGTSDTIITCKPRADASGV